MLMADGGGGGGWIPAFNAIVAGASRVVEREVSEPYIDTFKIGVTAAKLGGRALLGLAIAGDVIDVATAPPGQRVQRAICDGASLAGAIYGGEIGAEIGSAAGPVGTVVGGLVGAAIGSGVAEKAVSWVGSLL